MKQNLLLKGGFWITFSTFILRFVNLLSNLILARLLLPSEFGVIGIAYIFWSFFTLFTQDTAGTFIVYKGTEEPRYVNTAYTVSLLIGLILGLGLVGVAPLAATFFNEPNLTLILIAFAFNLLLTSAYYVQVGVMTRQMQYQEIAITTIVSSLTRIVCTIGSAFLGLSYWSFVIGDTASWLVGFILTRYQSGHSYKIQIDPEIRAEVVSFCLGVTGSSFGFYVNANADNFIVGKLLGSTSLGFYNLAYQMTMALSTILNSVIGQLGMPVFAQIESEKEQKKALFKVVEQVAFITAPLYGLFFLVIDKEAIAFLFGPQWTPVASVIPWLLVFAYFRIINTPLNTMLAARGRPDVNAKVNLCIAPIAALSFIIGAQHEGIVGVSIAVAIVLGIVWTFYWWWVGCRVLRWSMLEFLIPCFIPLVMAIPALIICLKLPLILKPIAFMAIYIICLRIVEPEQFISYQKLLIKSANKIVNLRNSR